MKFIPYILFFIISMLSVGNIDAQNLESDAVKFSTTNNDGSARFVAVGGAMAAVGADITNISYNPAGIGVYKSSVALITPSVEWTKSDAKYLKSSFQNQTAKFNISNAGAVFYLENKKHSALKNFNIGVSFQTNNSFNQKNEFRQNTANSITQNWLNEANTVNGSSDGTFTYDKFSFETVGAYYSYLVNFDSSLLAYTSPITNSIRQRSLVETRGSSREINFATGLNLFDKFYLGGAVSIPLINYYSTTQFYEADYLDSNLDFEDFKLTNEYKNTGTGFNLKIGAIYKPIQQLRLSAGVQTKTRMNLKEAYSSDFVTNFETESFESNSSLGQFEYVLSTPWRANAGVAMVLKKYGFLSFDYEMVDYTAMKFIFKDDFAPIAEAMNSNIKSKYTIAHNFKAGAEVKIKKYRIRAGYHLQTSPLKADFRAGKNDFSRHQFSGGAGVVWKRISLDAAYRYSMSKAFEVSYDGTNGINKNTDTQLFLISLGFKISK